jgi:(S)-ureidoglycine aminohydrolase
MFLPYLGQTRSARKRDHLLQTPDTFIRAVLPGMQGATAIVHTGPALGGAFTQYTAEMEAGGTLGSTTGQRFIYVLEGSIAVQETALTQGSYAFIAEGDDRAVKANCNSCLAVIEKRYQPVHGSGVPSFFAGCESDMAPEPLLGDEAVLVRSLVPDDATYDFAVNTITYQPGASLSMVEIHIMEHGLLMLEGGGIYRLGDCWYPVSAGDFIWMAPYCPQWFGALGKTPAKYLIYKDWNRHPL